jgi:agmatinase
MGYLQIDAHLDAGTEIGGERQTNCNGLIRATELANLSVENMAVIGVRGTINVPDWWEAVRERGIPVYPMRR